MKDGCLAGTAGTLLAAALLTASARAEPEGDGNGAGPERRVERLQEARDMEERAQSERAEGAATTAPKSHYAKEVRAVLERQQAAWNRGDIDAFMEGYWKSDQLRFASGNTVTKGWRATLERYRKRYDSREKMGRLSFSGLDIRMLSANAALVFGRWKIERAEGAPSGLFTLLFRKADGRWVIVHDHTSSE